MRCALLLISSKSEYEKGKEERKAKEEKNIKEKQQEGGRGEGLSKA